MKVKAPLVTVLLPVYNAEKHLALAIESLLNQTFQDFTILTINDGSTDDSLQILKKYLSDGARLKIINNKKNLGVTRTLNLGLGLITTKYIARMDADDISLPQRLALQVDFMEKHQEVGICGSWIRIFSQVPGVGTTYMPKLSPEQIKANFLFENSLQHPTALLRSSIIKGKRYPVNYPHAEDYAFWVSMITKTNFAILPEVLLRYRLHATQVGNLHSQTQIRSVRLLHKDLLRTLGLDPTRNELMLHEQICLGSYPRGHKTIIQAEHWLKKLVDSNAKSHFFSANDLASIIGRKWFSVCVASSSLGTWVWRKYYSSPLAKTAVVSLSEQRYFFLETRLFPFLRPWVKKTKEVPMVRKIIRG